MPIRDNDLFLINNGGNSYKVRAKNLQESTGTLLVNRSSASYQCAVADVDSKIRNSDKLLVERNGSSYQVSGQELKNWFVPPSGLIYGLNWSGSDLAAGSSSISEDTFYDGNPNNGCVFVPKDGGIYSDRPYLRVDFTGRYKVTKVVYGAWTNRIANGAWEDSQYSATRAAIRTGRSNGGFSTSTTSISKNPSYEQDLSMQTAPDDYTVYIELSQASTTPGKMAVAKLEIYGYPVDSNGNPTR